MKNFIFFAVNPVTHDLYQKFTRQKQSLGVVPNNKCYALAVKNLDIPVIRFIKVDVLANF